MKKRSTMDRREKARRLPKKGEDLGWLFTSSWRQLQKGKKVSLEHVAANGQG